jgi:hypothetical protein
MKPGRRMMVWTGWAMTLIGVGVVLFWTFFEAVSSFKSAPLATTIGVLVVLAVVTLLVPVPLMLATRRARAARRP